MIFFLFLALLVTGSLIIDYLQEIDRRSDYRITHYDSFIVLALLLFFVGFFSVIITQ